MTIGAMAGAVLGMKSERKIGLVHGAAVGAFTGASFSLHAVSASFSLWISFHDNEPLSLPLFIEVITSILNPTLVYLGEKFGPGMHGPVRNQDVNADDADQVATVETNNQVPRFIDRKGGNALHRGSILDNLPKTRITDKNIYDSSGNRISCSVCLEDKQEFIDIVETVYRGARKGRGLVIAPKDYSTKYRY
ncbi:hypothetical protein TEA_012571 [Camellia sinensis var. sinensis]|uniref:Uncharacterized protein n=1 Tax=Camellia sinensis var. sinensis TaxID=542762 RepID=A0A4S4EPI2_CAMSN|nr:hypothetical protein TEA_012571 [Camellia sinensis var. sinensis]